MYKVIDNVTGFVLVSTDDYILAAELEYDARSLGYDVSIVTENEREK